MILAKRTIKLCGEYKVTESIDKCVYSDKIPRYFYCLNLYHGRQHVGGNDTEMISAETAQKLIEQIKKEKK